MATSARLAALLSVLLAVGLNLWSTPAGTSGLVSLIGWVTVGLLIVGLVIGHRGAVAAVAVGFTMRLGLVGAMGGPIAPELWVQALVLVLTIEAAAISFTLRVRPVDPLVVMLRGLTTALGAAVAVQILGQLVAGTETGGLLVRVAGIAALVLAAGWVIRTWRKSGLTA